MVYTDRIIVVTTVFLKYAIKVYNKYVNLHV